MDANELKHQLGYFTGTEHWYRYSPLFPKLLLTDGAKFLAEEAGAYWLMDAIGSHLPSVTDSFAIVHLAVHPDRWATLCIVADIDEKRDDAGRLIETVFINPYAEQHIERTDFPLDEVKLYLVRDPQYWVVLLPSEY